MYNKKTHIHFVGIGGIGMSGIATILHYQGYTISGCDVDLHQTSIKNLQHLGCVIHQGNNSLACQDPSIDIVVYSSAISKNMPEIMNAQKRGIPTIPRALMLAEIMRTKYSVAIAGSHGKTTTTSLISHILMEANMDPTVIIGGHLKTISTNARLGSGDFLVAETDESDRSFLHLYPTIALVTNIDLEHLDMYKDLDDIKQAFAQFLNNLPFYGCAIICADDPNIRSLLPIAHIKTISYGLDPDADICGTDIILNPTNSSCVVYKKNQKAPLGVIQLPIAGIHNITNALGAITAVLELGVSFSTIAQALTSFKGVDRRFTFRGVYRNAEIFDDYGHHPREIAATVAVASHRKKNRLVVVFQPHRYSRTEKLWDLFIQTFLECPIDHLIITDIYAASEQPIEHITSKSFTDALIAHYPSFPVSYVPFDSSFEQLKHQLDTIIQKDDLILLQGAGKINQLAKLLNIEY